MFESQRWNRTPSSCIIIRSVNGLLFDRTLSYISMPSKSRKLKDTDSSAFPYKDGINPTSTSLLIRIQNKEILAWSRFMELYTPLIRDWCKKPGGKLNRQDRQDATQEVFVKAAKAIKDFDIHREGRSFRAWLRVITTNVINDFLEKRAKRKDVDRLMSDSGPIKETYGLSFELSEDPNEKQVLLRQVLKSIKPQFSDRDWEILNLLVNAGKNSTEVASIMGVSGAVVRQVKSRILKRIREEYETLGIQDDLPDPM